MNLFILDKLPHAAARQNCDAHVRKIILESVEMMGYAYDQGHGFKPWPWLPVYGRHLNHPMSRWVRASRQNFDWTIQHAYALCDEFVYRWNKTQHHKCREHIDWVAANLPLKDLPDIGQTEWPRCFGKWKEIIEVTDDAVADYRKYYMLAKRHLAHWTKREIPDWWR